MRQLNKKEIKKVFKKVDKRFNEIYLILENVEYARNVATIFRTADAAGVRRMYLTGISQKPPFGKDLKKASRNKEESVEWMHEENAGEVISKLKKLGFFIIAIELTDISVSSYDLSKYLNNKEKICFIAGSEVFGIKKSTLEKCDLAVSIPMYGRGASLNVAASIAITLYSF